MNVIAITLHMIFENSLKIAWAFSWEQFERIFKIMSSVNPQLLEPLPDYYYMSGKIMKAL